jgi:hypothetical protein
MALLNARICLFWPDATGAPAHIQLGHFPNFSNSSEMDFDRLGVAQEIILRFHALMPTPAPFANSRAYVYSLANMEVVECANKEREAHLFFVVFANWLVFGFPSSCSVGNFSAPKRLMEFPLRPNYIRGDVRSAKLSANIATAIEDKGANLFVFGCLSCPPPTLL